MEKLTDEEILGLVALLNRTMDLTCAGEATDLPVAFPISDPLRPEEILLVHRKGPASDEASAPIMPLLRKLLKEGINRGIVRVPPCFKGEL